MITNKDIEAAIQKKIDSYLDNSLALSGLTRGYHSDMFYNNDQYHDIDITIVQSTGDIQREIVQYPVQIMIDCMNELKDEMLKILHKLALEYNEHKTTVAGIDVIEFYKTPAVLTKFNRSGINDYITILLDCSFFEYENLMNIEELVIDDETIPFINFAVSYVGNTVASGGLSLYDVNTNKPKESGQVSHVIQSAANTYVFTCIPKTTPLYSRLILQALTCTEQNQVYETTISARSFELTKDSKVIYDSNWNMNPETNLYVSPYYQFENDEFIPMVVNSKTQIPQWNKDMKLYKKAEPYTMKCKATQISYTKDLQGFPILQVTLVRGVEQDG